MSVCNGLFCVSCHVTRAMRPIELVVIINVILFAVLVAKDLNDISAVGYYVIISPKPAITSLPQFLKWPNN